MRHNVIMPVVSAGFVLALLVGCSGLGTRSEASPAPAVPTARAPDGDGDGVPDADDQCPQRPEVPDGCPDAEPERPNARPLADTPPADPKKNETPPAAAKEPEPTASEPAARPARSGAAPSEACGASPRVMIGGSMTNACEEEHAGEVFAYRCPAFELPPSPLVYGTTAFTRGSPICQAAVYTGRITTKGGTVKARILASRGPWPGGEVRNGVKSSTWSKSTVGFELVD